MGNLRYTLLCFCALLGVSASIALAQPDSDAQLRAAIQMARFQLESHVPRYPTNELARLADVLGRSNYVSQAIQQAVANGNITNARTLFDTFSGTANDITFAGQPLLIIAATQDNPKMVELLLLHKATPDASLPNGETALFRALQSGRFDTALLLVEAGADPSRTNFQGASALSLASRVNWGNLAPGIQEKLISKMLDAGADQFAPAENQSRTSIIEQSLRTMNPAIGEILLTNRPDPARRTPEGDTALHLAVEYNRTNVIDFLLTNGFSINQTNSEGLTPLQVIAQGAMSRPPGMTFGPRPGFFPRTRITGPVSPRGFVSFAPFGPYNPMTADWLLQHGATLDVWSAAALGKVDDLASTLATNAALANTLDGVGRSPLHYAVLASELTAAKILIRAGSEVSARTSKPIRSLPSQYGNANSPIAAGSTPAHLACIRDDGAMLQLLLRSGTDPRLEDDDGDQPLHIAARSWQLSPRSLCGSILIGWPVSVDLTNHAGKTALRIAVENGRDRLVGALLGAGAKQNIGLATNTLLHLAAGQGSQNTISNLLAHGHTVDERDAGGVTPFDYAAIAHQAVAMKFLLDRGADINAADKLGNTSLHQAVAQQYDTIGYMLELPWLKRWQQRWQMQPGFRQGTVGTLVKWKILKPLPAMTWTNESLAIWLLDHHANPNMTNQLGQTPLHELLDQNWMTYNSQNLTNRVTALLKAGARVDAKDAQGRTPIHLAATLPAPAVLSRLAAQITNVSSLLDAEGRTPLHVAVANIPNGYQPTAGTNVMVLLSLGADPNIRDRHGSTPLHFAVTNRIDRRVALINALLEHHADPNARDELGRSPLQLLGKAIRDGDYFYRVSDALETLIKGGANPALLDSEGQTILHRWCDQGNSHSGNIDQILRDLVAKHPELVNLTNAAGETPLHVAARTHDFQAAQLLLRQGADPLLRNARGETVYFITSKSPNNGLANQIRPKGTTFSFSNTINTRNQREFDVWLDADPNLAKLTFDDGQTPLELATRPGIPASFAEKLLGLGATLNPISALRLGKLTEFRSLAADTNVLTLAVLTEAMRLGRFEEIEDLAALSKSLRASDSEGFTLLHFVPKDHPTVADWLRAHGVIESPFDATASGDTNYLAELIASNPATASATNSEGQSLVMLAARYSRADAARLLIAHGAQLETSVGHATALMMACTVGASDVVESLLNARAEVEVWQQNGLTPLHLAVIYGQVKTVQVFLDHGVNPDLIQTNRIDNMPTLADGSTPLHWAADWGRVDIVKLLLQHGANVHATNQAGDTPLDVIPVELQGQTHLLSPPPRCPFAGRSMNLAAPRGEIVSLLTQAGAIRRKP